MPVSATAEPIGGSHEPVLANEVMTFFAPVPGDVLLDATIGLGGHARSFLEHSSPTGRVVGLDADPRVVERAQAELAEYSSRVHITQGNFAALKDSIPGGGIVEQQVSPSFSHILFDLGVGSHQLSDHGRGFSFQQGEELSMRYGDQTGLPPAQLPALNQLQQSLGYLPDVPDILTGLSARDLAHVIRNYGEERYAGPIARALNEAQALTTTQALAAVISSAVPASYRLGRLHPATRTFQALRLAVNRELEALQVALPQAFELTKIGGLIAVISFHSLEDRIVKRFFAQGARVCICPPEQPMCTCSRQRDLEVLTKKPVVATAAELQRNPRSRSAKLRVARVLGRRRE